MCLAPARDFFCFGETARNAEVNAAIVHQILFDYLLEFPLAIELFANGQRQMRILSHESQALCAFTSQWVFDEKETVAILPLRCLLQGEDRGVFRGSGKRVCEFAVLKLE